MCVYIYILSDVDAELPVEITLAGETLSDEYCVDQAAAAFTYYIPLHRTMPVNSSLSLQ